MLTRLKVSGFKNLVDVDVRFGPFTCIAGANGTGKSNLFDAIQFLSALADKSLIEAALSVRDKDGQTGDIRSLFNRVGDIYEHEMSFEVEMIVPEVGKDHLNQEAKAAITFLKYHIVLRYREDYTLHPLGSLELVRETLDRINIGEAPKSLLFDYSREWKASVIKGRRTSSFIETEQRPDGTVILLRQDGSSGRPQTRLAATLPRTVLSATNAAESPTAVLAKNEMKSWQLLQLEPTALRHPDEFTDPSVLGTDGSHLPSVLYRLAHTRTDPEQNVYEQVIFSLRRLLRDVHDLWVERDNQRRLLKLKIKDRYDTEHEARALSDGTLRFLALSVIDLDPQAQGVICLEEPENGIHPERIQAMLELLQGIAVDTDFAVDNDNPLRQVIINTHSPSVIMQIPAESLVISEVIEDFDNGLKLPRVSFGCLPDTWRANSIDSIRQIPIGTLMWYLNPHAYPSSNPNGNDKQRVIDRTELQQLLPGFQD